jgi:signal transduction histidine kinase
VIADRSALEHVLGNLLDNAIKYTPAGGRVAVRVRQVPEGRVRIEVEDSGMGIPRKDLPRIFERFYRVDPSRSRALGGTGLGLAIVKHQVQAMGGQLGVESQLGRGSRWVELPAAAINLISPGSSFLRGAGGLIGRPRAEFTIPSPASPGRDRIPMVRRRSGSSWNRRQRGAP